MGAVAKKIKELRYKTDQIRPIYRPSDMHIKSLYITMMKSAQRAERWRYKKDFSGQEESRYSDFIVWLSGLS